MWTFFLNPGMITSAKINLNSESWRNIRTITTSLPIMCWLFWESRLVLNTAECYGLSCKNLSTLYQGTNR